jgi:hypothetical protein
MSVKDVVGARDKWRREDSFPFKDPAILRMGLFLDGLSLDMVTVKRERSVQQQRGVCSSHGYLAMQPKTKQRLIEKQYKYCYY